MLAIIAAALLPVLILVAFILRKDRQQPEPPTQLLRAFGAGVLSVIPAVILANVFAAVGLVPAEFLSVGDAVRTSFWEAAIPEEIAKLLMLWLVLRRNPWFDEKMDGIVYAVCVSLGFAATENIFYLIGNAEQYVELGITRALFAVPGHFCMGVIMGYYYSRARFCVRARLRHVICILAAPILAHGVYDSLLFAAQVSEMLRAILCILFLVFCYQLWHFAARRIKAHLLADGVLTR